MGNKPTSRKRPEQAALADIPRMVAQVDADLVAAHAALLTPQDTVIELGPWLGFLSARLAARAQLVVVDSFRWTKDHDRRVPGLHAPGASFRGTFEANLAQRGLTAQVVETDFARFRWTGGPVRLCVIDAPKSAEALAECLAGVWGGLGAGSVLVIKNAKNPSYPDLQALLAALDRADVLKPAEPAGAPSCNCAVLAPGPGFSADALGPAVKAAKEAPATPPETEPERTPERLAERADAEETFAAMVRALTQSDFPRAYAALHRLPPAIAHTANWRTLEDNLLRHGVDAEGLAVFDEILHFHTSAAGGRPAPVPGFQRSAPLFLRAFWAHNAEAPWRGQSFRPDVLTRAFDFGYAAWPARHAAAIRGADVLDVGCGPGLHGLACLAAGARSYTGADPAFRPQMDRVKNLTRRERQPFGWTADQLAAIFPAWTVRAQRVEDLPEARAFDVALLHDTAEHLMDFPGAMAAIAARLRAGGTLIFNLHNYYAWNGHHQKPQTPDSWNRADPGESALADWGHVTFLPPPDHYIATGLNRLRIDEVLEVVSRHFDLTEVEDVPSRPEVLVRLTRDIRRRFPNLTERDLAVQGLQVSARLRRPAAD